MHRIKQQTNIQYLYLQVFYRLGKNALDDISHQKMSLLIFFFYIPWSQNFYCFPRAIDVLFQKNLPKLSWLVHVSCKINLWKKENHLLLGGFLFLNIPFINKCVRFLGDNTGPTAFLWENILWHYIKFLEPSPHDFWDCKKKQMKKNWPLFIIAFYSCMKKKIGIEPLSSGFLHLKIPTY